MTTKTIAIAAVCACVVSGTAHAQEWSGPVRGSWLRANDRAQAGDVTLAQNGNGCELVVAGDEHSAVRQAAAFLATDIERISGYKPPVVQVPSGHRVAIRLSTTAGAHEIPAEISRERLNGRWEAYQIRTTSDSVWLVGSRTSAARRSPPTP